MVRLLILAILLLQAGCFRSGADTACPATPAWAAAVVQDEHGCAADLVVGGVTQRFRWIPPGTFTMGSPQAEKDAAVQRGGAKAAWFAHESQHQVAITTGFWMADSPCTQALWQVITGADPAHFNDHLARPVEQVSWPEVQAFLASLDGRTANRGFRLPTEAEWEYACRAGTATATYAGDLDYRGRSDAPILEGIAWYAGNSDRGWSGAKRCGTVVGTWPVKQRQPNAWGLYDMLGNVGQWCADWYGDYPAAAVADPTGPASGSTRVHRGGSWLHAASICRSACRQSRDPGCRDYGLGFRIVAPSTPPR